MTGIIAGLITGICGSIVVTVKETLFTSLLVGGGGLCNTIVNTVIAGLGLNACCNIMTGLSSGLSDLINGVLMGAGVK